MIGRALFTLASAAFDAARAISQPAADELWARATGRQIERADDLADIAARHIAASAADRLADKEAEQEVSEPPAVGYTESAAAQALRDASWPHGRNWDGYPDAEAARHGEHLVGVEDVRAAYLGPYVYVAGEGFVSVAMPDGTLRTERVGEDRYQFAASVPEEVSPLYDYQPHALQHASWSPAELRREAGHVESEGDE